MMVMRGIIPSCVFLALGAFGACGGQARDGSQKIGDGPPSGGESGASFVTGSGGATSGGASGGKAGARTGNGGSGAGGTDFGHTFGPKDAGADGNSDFDAHPTCMPLKLPTPCDWDFACVEDFRAVASRFPTCFRGPDKPAVGRCGAYDALFYPGIDTEQDYFYDHVTGHFVGLKGSGLDAGTCLSVDPSFEPPTCEGPPLCPNEDGGGESIVTDCEREEPADAGAPPAFCPMPGFPRPVLGSKPSSIDFQSMTVKFIEGSHVRMQGSQLVIDPLKMLDEDPGLLRCAHLTVPGATCELERLLGTLYSRFQPIITRTFGNPEELLDQMRADGRANSGMYLSDENLFYDVTGPTAQLSPIYDTFARSPLVDTVYWDPIPSNP